MNIIESKSIKFDWNRGKLTITRTGNTFDCMGFLCEGSSLEEMEELSSALSNYITEHRRSLDEQAKADAEAV